MTWASDRLPRQSVIDLSRATKESMALWIKNFTAVSLHPESWVSNGADQVALLMHDSMAAVGEATMGTVEALSEGRKILKAVAGGPGE